MGSLHIPWASTVHIATNGREPSLRNLGYTVHHKIIAYIEISSLLMIQNLTFFTFKHFLFHHWFLHCTRSEWMFKHLSM